MGLHLANWVCGFVIEDSDPSTAVTVCYYPLGGGGVLLGSVLPLSPYTPRACLL